MSAQTRLITETVNGMRRVITRYQESSDSDEPYLQPTNRGNKLKRKTYDLEDSYLARAKGPKIFKRRIEHGGYQRNILRRNPRRYDEDGEELADSDSDGEADARAAEDNPYTDIHLENLLLPLVSAARLPNHPSLSSAYSSPILTNMAQHACEMAQRERRTLANAKRMMTKLRGDETWLPCGLMYSKGDEAIFETEKLYKRVVSCRPTHGVDRFTARDVFNGEAKNENASDSRNGSISGRELGSSRDIIDRTHKESTMEFSVNGEKVMTKFEVPVEDVNGEDVGKVPARDTHEERGIMMTEDTCFRKMPEDSERAEKMTTDEAMDIIDHEDSIKSGHQSGEAMQKERAAPFGENDQSNRGHSPRSAQPSINSGDDPGTVLANENILRNHLPTPAAEEPENDMSEVGTEGQDGAYAAPRRMRTRAQAQAASEAPVSSRNMSPESWVPPEVHHLFKIPEMAIPDKDFGLPSNEADETCRLVTMYVQKQEEVCRGAEKLYDGLLRVDRQRKEVLNWCKAEGHVGEMSDGEDWYDKEEWGLEADLTKGQDEEDGDPNPIQGKKTRGRRV